MYVRNNRASKYVKQNLTDLKGNLGKSTIIIIGDFNTSLPQTDRTNRQKMSKHIEMNNIINQDLIDTYREHSTPKQENTHFQVPTEHFKCPR